MIPSIKQLVDLRTRGFIALVGSGLLFVWLGAHYIVATFGSLEYRCITSGQRLPDAVAEPLENSFRAAYWSLFPYGRACAWQGKDGSDVVLLPDWLPTVIGAIALVLLVGGIAFLIASTLSKQREAR